MLLASFQIQTLKKWKTKTMGQKSPANSAKQLITFDENDLEELIRDKS